MDREEFENGKVNLLDANTLQVVRLLPGPIERVWAYLVEADKRARWFAGGDMDLTPGTAFRFDHDHGKITDTPEPPPEKYKEMTGSVTTTATIVRAEAPGLLVFEWLEGDGTNSEVTISLQEEEGNVRLTLTHRRLPESERISVSSGWHGHLDILEDELNGRVRRPFWSRHASLEKWYAE